MRVRAAGSETLLGVAFATDDIGYVVGSNETVYRTTNGGHLWSAVGVIDGDPGDALNTFRDVETWGDGDAAILVGDSGEVFERTTGNFTIQTLGGLSVQEHLLDVEVVGDSDVVRIGGADGVVLFRDLGVWSQVRSRTNAPVNKLCFLTAGTGFGIGQGFVILKYGP